MKKVFGLLASAGLLACFSCGNGNEGTDKSRNALAADSSSRDSSTEIQVGSNSSNNIQKEERKSR